MQTLTKTFNHSVKHRKKDGEEKTGKKSLETETERAKSNADPLENGERLDAFVWGENISYEWTRVLENKRRREGIEEWIYLSFSRICWTCTIGPTVNV